MRPKVFVLNPFSHFMLRLALIIITEQFNFFKKSNGKFKEYTVLKPALWEKV